MSEVKNNVNINSNLLLKQSKDKANKGEIEANQNGNELNINVNNNNNSFTPLNAKIADTIGYAQDVVSSATLSAQEFLENNPSFAFKTVAEQLRENVVTGLYSNFSELVDKLLLGAFRGVTLALDGWQFLKKLKEKNKILKQIEEKKLIDINSLPKEDREKIARELEKLARDLEEKKLDLSVSGGRVVTDILGFVGALAVAFSFAPLASVAPYLVAAGIVGDIVGVSYFAYKSIKSGTESLSQKLAQRREKELKSQQAPNTA